jgi:hypothetical protein
MSRRSRLLASFVIVGLLGLLGWWLWPVSAPEPQPAAEAPEPTPIVQGPVNADSDHDAPIEGSISGTVRVADERGEPIAGARVCAWALADDDRIRDPLAAQCTLTEPDGHYRLEVLEGGRHRLTASAAKHVPSTWRDTKHAREWLTMRTDEQRGGVDLTLLPGGLRLVGVVEDVSGGSVPGALIVASTMRKRGPVATALGDDEGRFEIWVAPNEYVIRAIASGYAEGGAIAQAPNETIAIHLVPESVLVGHVIDAASNEPLAGIEVSVRAGELESTVSGEDGSFRIGGLRPGRYQPEASGAGVFGRLPRAVVLGLGQTSEPIELLVYPAYRVSGQLLARSQGGSERGCAEGQVRVRSSVLRREVSTDADGQVRIEGLPAGRYQIEPSCPGYFPHDPVELLLDADLDDQRWLFESGLEIAGIAVDGSNRPVPGLYVDSSGTGPNAGGSIARTDADGRFVLGPLRPDSYGVWLRIDAEDPDKQVEVELRDRSVEDVRLVVGETGTVLVSVRDAEGTAIPNEHVTVKAIGSRSSVQAFTDGEGNVSFTGLSVGTVSVARTRDTQPGERKPQGVRVEVLAGEVTPVELRAETSSSGSITGIVTEAGGPAGEAWVVAGHGQGEDDETSPVLCDQDGRFTIPNLPDGTYNVRAYREGGGQAVERGIAVGESVRLDLESPTSLFGHVRFADGTAPEHFLVELFPTDAGRPISLSFYRSEGKFEFESLAAGRYTVEIDAGSGQAREKIELEPGERGELEFELDRRVTVTGRIVDAYTRAGVSALTVQVQPRGRPATRIVQPDREGRFVLTNVPVGNVQLSLVPKNWESPAYSLQLTWITTTDAAEQDIGDVIVAGKRRARGEAKGDVGFDYDFDGRFNGAEATRKVRVRVSAVDRGGSADAAGLRVGDIITSVDGVSVVGNGAGLMRFHVLVAAGATMQLEREDGGSVTIVAR